MMYDPHLAEREMMLKREQALARAEQTRLARLAQGPRKSNRRLRLASALSHLVAAVKRQLDLARARSIEGHRRQQLQRR
jgi:hypothetical protein